MAAVPNHQFFEFRQRLRSATDRAEGQFLTVEKKKILRERIFIAIIG